MQRKGQHSVLANTPVHDCRTAHSFMFFLFFRILSLATFFLFFSRLEAASSPAHTHTHTEPANWCVGNHNNNTLVLKLLCCVSFSSSSLNNRHNKSEHKNDESRVGERIGQDRIEFAAQERQIKFAHVCSSSAILWPLFCSSFFSILTLLRTVPWFWWMNLTLFFFFLSLSYPQHKKYCLCVC